MSEGASGKTASEATLRCGGLEIDACFERLRACDPSAEAFYAYDLDVIGSRARRLLDAFAPLKATCAYALKANALPAIVRRLAEPGFGADCGSVGELEVARASGVPAGRMVLNGNGRTLEEARWAARHGVGLVNADLVPELDLLNQTAAERSTPLRVALRVNPGVPTPGHRHVATGDPEAKFGMAPADALEAWAARDRWPNLQLDGVHVHVGSQLLDPAPMLAAVDVALGLADEAARRGVAIRLVNAGGGMGIDEAGAGGAFPLEAYARELVARAQGRDLAWWLEPGRWLVGPAGFLVSRVRWVKERDGRRFIVLAAGMNDLIRPALYGATHRIEPVRPRSGPRTPAIVAGPLCESGDVFARDAVLPPVEPGDLVVLRDAGAYGASMASNYNGRGRLAEVVVAGGEARLAREAETPAAAAGRACDRRLDPL